MKKVIKTRIQSSIAAAVIAAFPIASIAQESTETRQPAGAQTQQSGQSATSGQSSSGGGGQSTLPEKLQGLVGNIADTNMNLIQLGFAAQAKAKSKQVQQYAGKSVEDSVKAQRELAKLANENGFELQSKGGQSQSIEGTGTEFETKYLEQVQQMQQKLAQQLESEGSQIQNEQLKKFISKHLSDTLKDANETQKLAQQIQKGSPAAIGEAPKESPKKE